MPGTDGRKAGGFHWKPALVAAVFITAVLMVALASVVWKKYSPTKERVDLRKYYQVQGEEDMAVVLDGKLLDQQAKYWDGHVYLEYAMVQEYLNQRFYWDANEEILRYVSGTELISVPAGGKEYRISEKQESKDYAIVQMDGGQAYLALDFVQDYTNLAFEVYEEPARVAVTASWGEIQTSVARRDTEIRVRGGVKSPIAADVKKGDILTILQMGEQWSEACTEDGMVGYVRNRHLDEVQTKQRSRAFEEPEIAHISKEGRISLGWHQVTNQEANEKVADVLASAKGVNVISPTWFYLNSNRGEIHSLASKEYVEYCHKNQVDVWGLVSNLENAEVDSTYVLTHTSIRDHLTEQIVESAVSYGLDGINLDFEALSGEAGDAYIQFVRELSLKCKENNLALSVDNYVPSSYTAFYNRREQAVFADYVVIMGYDEHTSVSEDIGPVASIGFVEKGVKDTLEEVPAEQVILGMPFYSRIWEMTPKDGIGDDVESASEGYLPYTFTCFEEGMQTVEDRYKENGAEAVWSEEAGQEVVEYESEGKTYKIWIENEASLKGKLEIMKSHNLAGAAYWKLGLERPSVWDTIAGYLD
ncbi:glycosyl hydrolase family 18 protein [Lachnospiraceae bacterium 29-84]